MPDPTDGTPTHLEIAKLLQPISADYPCGVDLKYDTLFDEVKAARNTSDKAAVEMDEPPKADWNKVITLTTEALATRTKDLQLACWLTEALTQTHGFSGFRDGVALVDGLLNTFWDGVYPLVEEGDLETRLGPLEWLTAPDRGPLLPNMLREIPIAPPVEGTVMSWRFWNSRNVAVSSSDDESTISRKRAESEERKQKFERAVAIGNREHFRRVNVELSEALANLSTLSATMDHRFGSAAPGVTALRESLEACKHLTNQILKAKGGDEPATAPDDAEAELDGASAAGEAAPRSSAGRGPIRSREEAFQRLAEIAAYLKQCEPLSPVPYLIERAVTWGRMPFYSLLDELLPDENARTALRALLGLKDPSDTGGSSSE